MTAKVWPETLCSEDCGRPKLEVPMRLGGYIVCTDGHQLARISDDGRDADEACEGLDIVCAPFGREHPDALTFDLASLREWCGPAEDPPCPKCGGEPAACERCKGEGGLGCVCRDCGVEHWRTCPECNGRGHPRCDECGSHETDLETLDRLGTLGLARFSRRRLRFLLDGAPGETVRVAETGESTAIVVLGEGWDGLLMPIRPVHDGGVDAEDTKPLEPLAIQPTEAS